MLGVHSSAQSEFFSLHWTAQPQMSGPLLGYTATGVETSWSCMTEPLLNMSLKAQAQVVNLRLTAQPQLLKLSLDSHV